MTKICLLTATVVFAFTASAFATVDVSSPANGTTVSSPVHYVASGSTSTCSKGVAAMGIYVDEQKQYVVDATTLNTSLAISPGAHETTVEEWDRCGGASVAHLDITVGSASSAPPGVTVTSPANGATVTSPVHYVASAGTSCAQGVASMGIYVDYQKQYVVDGSSLNTSLAISAGKHETTVEEWDRCGGAAVAHLNITVESSTASAPTVSITANPNTVQSGGSSTLTVTATNATAVTVTGGGDTWNLPASGGTVTVDPTQTTTYTAEAESSAGTASGSATVSVISSGGLDSIQHVIFMLQENHTFDDYFGMLNPYRESKGWNIGDDGKTYDVDGIDDKLNTISNEDDEGHSYSLFKFTSTCIDDDSSAWLASYGDINRYNFLTTRPILGDGFVHTAEGYAKNCAATGTCSGAFTDTSGQRAMGYYDQDFLNYYYFMASEFAVSDRWFSPIASKSVDNRIATFTGGTTQGLTQDPGLNDHLPQLDIATIFEELDQANVSWKIYFTVTQGLCLDEDDCSSSGTSKLPATYLTNFTIANKYFYENPSHAACTGSTKPSSVVGDSSNSFCIDISHVAPISTYFTDLTNGTLPSFAFIEAGYGHNDEHPGSGQSILEGQAEMAKILNAFMASSSWKDSVFFFSYDEGGGPYDHVPPVPGHSNDKTDASLGTIPDISQIAVNPDSYFPCVPPGSTRTTHCDLNTNDPGAHPGDAAAKYGFAAQLGFRLPNMIISPFTRRHYVSHTPMDHTAVIKFVENRFIGSSAHLTARDAAQPNLLEFFDFSSAPWATPPSPPSPVTEQSLGYNPCTPTNLGQ